MSVVAGTPSMDMPKAWRVTTWPFWVTLMMTERRCSVAIAFWTMSVIADAVCPGGVAAGGAVAPDAAAGSPRGGTARRAPAPPPPGGGHRQEGSSHEDPASGSEPTPTYVPDHDASSRARYHVGW